MFQEPCSPLDLFLFQGSILASNEPEEIFPATSPFPELPASYPFVVDDETGTATRKRRSSLVSKNQYDYQQGWVSFFKELFVSRTVFDSCECDDEIILGDMTIGWSTTDEDSDITASMGFDEWDNDWIGEDEEPSEEDTFCVETILRRDPSHDSSDDESSVLVTWSTIE